MTWNTKNIPQVNMSWSYWVGREQELEMGTNVRQLAAIPFSHVRVLVQFYWSLRELLTRKK